MKAAQRGLGGDKVGRRGSAPDEQEDKAVRGAHLKVPIVAVTEIKQRVDG